MKKIIDKYLAFMLMGVILFGMVLSVEAAPKQFIPQLGYSKIVGSTSGDWKPGFTIGLDIFQLKTAETAGIPQLYGLHLAYNRWQINSSSMLKTGGHEMRVERERGSKYSGDITGLVRLSLPYLQSRNFRHWLDFGLGVHYIHSSDVEAKGFYKIGDTAVNREISRDSKTDVSPSITVGFTAMIYRQVQPSVRYQHFFESGVSRSGALLISLGMLAR